MCKSSSLAFVLIFAFLFKLERPTLKLISIIAVMTIGVVMMVSSETQFVLIGFLLVIASSALSGLRWSLTQLLLVQNPATSNPFSTILFLTPFMFISLFACAIVAEGFFSFLSAPIWLEYGIFKTLVIIACPGMMAFCMTTAEFTLLKRTSVVTLSIAGIFKELATITVASLVFGDHLTPINLSGLLITLVAIIAYNILRFRSMKEELQQGSLQADQIEYVQLHRELDTALPTDVELCTNSNAPGIDYSKSDDFNFSGDEESYGLTPAS